MAQHQLPGLGTATGIVPVALRLTLTDEGTPHEPLIVRQRVQVRHRHGHLLTVSEEVWKGRMLDLIPPGWSDMAAAFLWGESNDVMRAHRDLHHAARRHARRG